MCSIKRLRFPGARAPAELAALLQDKRDLVTQVPFGRWDLDQHYDPTPGTPGKTYVKCGGFLDRVEEFDAGFFDIADGEARVMDPQQRLLLETAFAAFHDSGLSKAGLNGSRTGVFVGQSNNGWEGQAVAKLSVFTGPAVSSAITANRLSYVFGLQGPSTTVDTACSSSLVALDQAVSSLRLGKSDTALASGVDVMHGPNAIKIRSIARMLAPDGRCKTFDARADGYARGEGCGALVLRSIRSWNRTPSWNGR